MNRVFLVMVVSALLVTFGFAQTPDAGSNAAPANVKGCLGGSEGNYSVVEDGTRQTFKISSSTVDLKPQLGHDVKLIGHKAGGTASSGAADNSFAVTEVSMISEHCGAAAAAAATVIPPAETVIPPDPAPVAPATTAAPPRRTRARWPREPRTRRDGRPVGCSSQHACRGAGCARCHSRGRPTSGAACYACRGSCRARGGRALSLHACGRCGSLGVGCERYSSSATVSPCSQTCSRKSGSRY